LDLLEVRRDGGKGKDLKAEDVKVMARVTLHVVVLRRDRGPTRPRTGEPPSCFLRCCSVLAWTCAAESNNTMQERMCVCSFLCCRTPPLADCHKFIACTLQCLNEEKRMGIAPLLEDDTTFVVLQCGLKCRRGGEVTRWSSRERRGEAWFGGGRRLGDGHMTSLLRA
jgi:hypothetical protein